MVELEIAVEGYAVASLSLLDRIGEKVYSNGVGVVRPYWA